MSYWNRRTARVDRVLSGDSKQKKGFTQSEVAELFEHGYNCLSSNETFESHNGILTHYRTIEAIKTLEGVIISNNECWARGFAHCTKPDYEVGLDLTTILNALCQYHMEELREIKIVATKDMDTVFSWRKRYFINGMDENRYVAELEQPCKSVEEALESMKPQSVKIALRHNQDVKRQGEYFFIALPALKTRDVAKRERIIQHLKLERDYFKEKDFVVEERLFPQIEDSRHFVTRKGESLGKTVAKGTVRHVEHRMLKLGELWHEVAKNTVKQSWSIGRGRD